MDNDLITQEIIQNPLQAAGDEMFAAMRKMAVSASRRVCHDLLQIRWL